MATFAVTSARLYYDVATDKTLLDVLGASGLIYAGAGDMSKWTLAVAGGASLGSPTEYAPEYLLGAGKITLDVGALNLTLWGDYVLTYTGESASEVVDETPDELADFTNQAITNDLSRSFPFRFAGWDGWPVASYDGRNIWTFLIQLWLACYERQLAIGAINDLPHRHFLPIIDINSDPEPTSDDLIWLWGGAAPIASITGDGASITVTMISGAEEGFAIGQSVGIFLSAGGAFDGTFTVTAVSGSVVTMSGANAGTQATADGYLFPADWGDATTAMPLVENIMNKWWSSTLYYGHAQHGGVYPGILSGPVGTDATDGPGQLWYQPFPDDMAVPDYSDVRWWKAQGENPAQVFHCLRSLQQWIDAHLGQFVIHDVDTYDGYTGRTRPDGSFDTNIPLYTKKEFCDTAGIPYDLNIDGINVDRYFTRKYPKEFRYRSSVTFTQIACDTTTTIVTYPASTTYIDGSAFVEGDVARCIGDNVEDTDQGLGIWCMSGWVEWPTAWRQETGKVYRRTGGAWMEVSNPLGTEPDIVTKKGFVERGDIITSTLMNELYAALNALVWTLRDFSFFACVQPDTCMNINNIRSSGYNVGDYDAAVADFDANWNTGASVLTTVNDAPLADATVSEVAGGDFLIIGDRRASYGYATGIPIGIPVTPAPIPTHNMESAADFLVWSEKRGDVFDANGDPVAELQWKVFDTEVSADAERNSVLLGSLDAPNVPAPYGESGYAVTRTSLLLRWDAGGGMTFFA